MLSDIVRLHDNELDQLLDALVSRDDRGRGEPSTDPSRRASTPVPSRFASWLPKALEVFGSVAGVTAAVRLLRDERRRVAKEDLIPSWSSPAQTLAV